MKTKTNTTSLGISVLLLTCTILLISCNGCRSSKVESVSIHTDKDIDNNQIASSDTGKDTTSHFDLGILKDAPMLPLEEVDITEVYDHYILQDSANYQKYHFYDGKRQQTVDFSGPDVHIQVSRNQKYLTKMTLIQNKMSNQYFLDVELRDCSNKLIAKQSIPSAYQDYYDEFRDDVIPLEDGSGLLQIGRRLGISCWVTGYKLEGTKLIKKIQIDKPDSFLYGIKSNADGSKIVITYNTKTEDYERDTIALYNMEKGLIWEMELPHLKFSLNHQWDESKTFLNKQEIYLFTWSNENDRMIRYNFDGQVVDSLEVEQIQHWDFKDSEEGEVLLIYSNKFLYIYNTKSKEVNKIDLYRILQLKGNAYISIRNAIFSKSSSSEVEKLIFTFFIKKPNNGEIHFSGVGFYNLKKNTIEVYNSAPFYGQVSSKNRDVFLQKKISYRFTEKIDKVDLNKIK